MAFRDSPVSREEEEKLVVEIKTLIEKRGLAFDLVPKDLAKELAAAGCSSCTVCPCMICW